MLAAEGSHIQCNDQPDVKHNEKHKDGVYALRGDPVVWASVSVCSWSYWSLQSFIYSNTTVVIRGMQSLVVRYMEYPIIMKEGEDMISGTNNTSSDRPQNRTIANTAPGRLLSCVCMFTMHAHYGAAVRGYDHSPLYGMRSYHNLVGSECCIRGG